MLILQKQKYLKKQVLFVCLFPTWFTHEMQETSQGCSLRAHSHSRADMQIFIWFCRLCALGIWVPLWRKWVTQFDFSGSYSYPVRRQVGKKKKKEKNPRKERQGGGRQMSRQWMNHPWSVILTCSVLCRHNTEKFVINVRAQVMELQLPHCTVSLYILYHLSVTLRIAWRC